MKKINRIASLATIFIVSSLFATSTLATTDFDKLSGRILLSVEDKGQAWYVEPKSSERVFLGRPHDAFRVMQEFGLGITESDYSKFQKTVPQKLAGKILLRVESKGEAYFVDPLDLSLHYMGRPSDALLLMRELGLGISKQNLAKITVKEGFAEIFYNEDLKDEAPLEVIEAETVPVQALEESVDDEEIIVEEIDDLAGIDLRDLELGEIKKFKKTTVKSSFPVVVVDNDNYALLWWDGFAAFSSFDSSSLALDRVHSFSGSSPGDIARNNISQAIAWEKNCRVYADVINDLGNSLSESKVVASRVGEGCPANIKLSSDANNFALLWTQGDADEKANMYFKIFTPKAISVNAEILISDMVDPLIEPAIVWNGEAYVVVWQEKIDQEKAMYMASFDANGKQLDAKKLLIANSDSVSNLELIKIENDYKLFWLENKNEKSFVKLISFNIEQTELSEINTIDIKMLVRENSVLSVVRNNEQYGISWESDNKQIYFMEINSDSSQSSSINLISDENTESTQAELFVIDNSYAIFWQANDDFSKAIYFREIK